ncbi:DNA polymerase beta [Cordyceps javanica]|nr:DNA polymerase beta [Cordyceps javanica]
MMPLSLPVIYLLDTHLTPEDLCDLEESIPTLTHDINEAEVVLGRVSRKQRAQFELRRLKLETEPIENSSAENNSIEGGISSERIYERRKLEVSEPTFELDNPLVRVVNLSWLTESLENGVLMPIASYVVYEGRKRGRRVSSLIDSRANSDQQATNGILDRAAAEMGEFGSQLTHEHKEREEVRAKGKENLQFDDRSTENTIPKPTLLRRSPSEFEMPLPPIPSYLHTTYSCQRPTPVNPPNTDFIEELKRIRTVRLLQGDKVGVRAYSTSIASIAAYPYMIHILKFTTATEVSRLPGCSNKLAKLYQEWHETGQTEEMRISEADPKVGWRDLDDIVEYGWQSLSRVQQIGLKYYEEFQSKIYREEVAQVADIILEHACRLDQNYEMAVVGGYRRGREESGDVDVILTHKEESKTFKLLENVVLSLEKDEYITHTLSLSTRNSDRGQVPLPWKGETSTWATGFDTLDKAMVVWLDPKRAGALHRRVDIIVSPWKTVGCAVLGWSGETTFQRDLRRYCKKERGLKFDSSGIRSRRNGTWVDFECGDSGANSIEEAEKRVFDGLGIPWRHPWERCTG